jgi:hypothetical protein
MSAIPAKASDSQTTIAAECTDPAPPAMSERDFTRAIALMLEGLVTESEFTALTGFDAQTVAQRLANTAALAEVQRTAMQMRNSGALARLEAARHARDAVQVAAQIMQDPEAHVSNRLNAATFIAKVSGTERAAPVDEPHEKFTITINLGDQPPVIVERKPPLNIGQQQIKDT